MGDIISSVENDLMELIRQDEYQKVKDIIIKKNIDKDFLIGPHKRTLIQHSAYFGSINCLKQLIELNFDINKLEYKTNNSPLFIACKFNYPQFVHILLNNEKQKCEILRKNNDGLNEFEVAFLRGNYEICYYLLYLYEEKNDIAQENDKINKYLIFFNDENNFILEKYLGMQEYLSFPIFNLTLFYQSLKQKIIPEQCPDYSAEKKKMKDLSNKIPDPNESWADFTKRLVKLELYNPPLVDKTKINRANSLYMKMQMDLLSKEYGIKMDYSNENELKDNQININNNNLNDNDNFNEKSTLK